MVDIEVANRSGTPFDDAHAVQLIRRVLGAEGVAEGEVGLVLVEPDEIRTLKRDHLGIDEETDVLAFPIDGLEPVPDGVPRHLGDIVLCPQLVGESWRAPLVHAVLHLVGYDHGSEMEARERSHA